MVRCVRCGTDWAPVAVVPVEDGTAGARVAEVGRAAAMSPDVPAEALPEAAPAELSPEPDPDVPTRRMALDDDPVVSPAVTPAATEPAAEVQARRGGAWLTIAWVASVLVVIGAVAALVMWRDAVMQAWPPSIRAYVALKLAARP